MNIEGRPIRPSVLPTGNDPEELALSDEGRRVLGKEIAYSMYEIWTEVGKVPKAEAERLANGILETEIPRRQLVEMHRNSQELRKSLESRLSQ